MRRVIRESGKATPATIRKTIPPSGLACKYDAPGTIPADFPRKYHRHGQTSNLPRGRSACKADRRKQPAKITQKTEVYVLILPHQSRKSNGTECKYAICLHSQPSRKAKYCCSAACIAFIAFSTENFTPKKLLKNVDIMTMTFVSLSVTRILNWKNQQNATGFCKKFGIRFSVKNQQKTPDFRESPAKSPETPRKI